MSEFDCPVLTLVVDRPFLADPVVCTASEGKEKGNGRVFIDRFFGQGCTCKALRHGSHSFTCK